MTYERMEHKTLLLNNDDVLAVGGKGAGRYIYVSELYHIDIP